MEANVDLIYQLCLKDMLKFVFKLMFIVTILTDLKTVKQK